MSFQQDENEAEPQADTGARDGYQNDSVANKLSRELSNWRQRRSHSRQRRNEGPTTSFQSDSARTIKVRGHETLVIRKPKVANRAPQDSDNSHR